MLIVGAENFVDVVICVTANSESIRPTFGQFDEVVSIDVNISQRWLQRSGVLNGESIRCQRKFDGYWFGSSDLVGVVVECGH